MKVGTKSVIFGVHSILVHPFFIARAWWRLYGFPWDPKLWVAFFVHDLGYIFKADMEGPSGEQHVILGGRIMGWLFGPKWRDIVLCHSRHWAKRWANSIREAMRGRQAGVCPDARLALPPDGTVERRTPRIHVRCRHAAVGWQV